MEVLDKVYYIRGLLGAVAGAIAGVVISPDTHQVIVIVIVMLTAIIFYLLSYVISKRIGQTIQKLQKRKLTTEGIFPFIFLLLMFMILAYTWLHQDLARWITLMDHVYVFFMGWVLSLHLHFVKSHKMDWVPFVR